jgi:hypothetical protein
MFSQWMDVYTSQFFWYIHIHCEEEELVHCRGGCVAPFSGGHFYFKWWQTANAHCPITSSPSQSSTLLKCKHLENKNSSIFLTAEWICTLTTSFGPDCKEYI